MKVPSVIVSLLVMHVHKSVNIPLTTELKAASIIQRTLSPVD